jgi:uncharacterized protein (DUF736 family)
MKMIIGKFWNSEDGRITGEVQALGIGQVDLTFQPNEKGADYTVVFTETGTEVGVAWKKTSKKNGGKSYISVRLDSPVLAAPFNAAMFPGRDHEGSFVLIWDRPKEDEASAA